MSVDQAALLKLQHFCAYQERCHSEVRSKLIKLEVYGDKLEEVMSQLIQEDFLNEERFARSFVSGKYRMNQWGKMKIIMKLKSKKVSEYCIKKGLEEINQEEYLDNLISILNKQKRIYARKNLNNYQLNSKLFQFAMGKGYETEIIKIALDELE